MNTLFPQLHYGYYYLEINEKSIKKKKRETEIKVFGYDR